MFLLGGYSFVNTLMLESFEYYHINANKLIIFLVFIAVTVGIWEGNRLWDNWVSSRQFTPFWKRISYNFAGSVYYTGSAAAFS